MRILALSNLYPPDVLGGYELACAQMVEALRARGHEVMVAAGAPRHPTPTVPHVRRVFRLVDEWSRNAMGQDRLVVNLSAAASRIVSAHNIHVLTQVIDEFQPDVVLMSNVLGLGGLGLVACLQYLKTPWVWHLGDCIPNLLCSKYEVYDGPIPTLATEFSRRFAGHYVVVSQQLRDQIEAQGVMLTGDVEVIPYWITGQRPPPPPPPPVPGPRRSDGVFRIMSAGQVTRAKGVDILIEAVALLRGAGVSALELDIYGEVNDPHFGSLIGGHKLGDCVRLMGPRPHRELLELYGAYDVFAFPTSEREAFGLVPLEAASRGCVPIISQRCGVAEWLVHGVHCLKAARRPEAFAAVFRDIIEQRIALPPIARRAEALVWRDFHIDVVLPRIERKLAAAASQSRAGGGTAAEAYRMARLAEQLTEVLVQEEAKSA